MKRKPASPLQIAARKRAWRILQLRGAITFLQSIGLHTLADSVKLHGGTAIEHKWKLDKEI